MDYAAVAGLSRSLLKSEFSSEDIWAFLKGLGEIVAVDRVYLFEHEVADSGHVLASQRYEWNSGRSEPQIDNPELQGLDMTELLPHWLDTLSKGENHFGIVRNLSAVDREILEPQDIKSILVCPIMENDEVWGFAGFDDCTAERTWSPAEIRVLGQASRALALGLRHRGLQERLQTARAALVRTAEVADEAAQGQGEASQ